MVEIKIILLKFFKVLKRGLNFLNKCKRIAMVITDKNICQFEFTVPLQSDFIKSNFLISGLFKILSKLF